MRDYGVIYSKVWTDPKFRLFSDSEKLLFVYLLTCEHSNLLGCFRLTAAYIADDLNWDLKKTKHTVSTLCQHGVIKVDTELFWIFIPKYLKYNPLKNESCGKGLVKLFQDVPKECSFYADLVEKIRENSKNLPPDFIRDLDTVSTQCADSVDYSTSTSTSTSTSILNAVANATTLVRKVADDDLSKNCPHEKIVDLYHELLPMCPQVREWNKTRKGYLRQRWAEDGERQSLDWWEQFFKHVAQSKFLTGRATARNDQPPFVADLEWILRPTNFTKIIEGKYHRG